MKHCIIHIGAHKTGSTSIQYSLGGFQDNDYFYARLGPVPNHSLAMYSLFAPQPERHEIHINKGVDAAGLARYIAEMRGELERSIAAAGDRVLLISGEDITVLPPAGLVSLRDFFKARFEKLTIVGYVRPPAGFINSGFQQRVKGGSVSNFVPEKEYRNYKKRYIKFDAIFGNANVQLWKFDPAAFPGGCAVSDFCARLGIKLPAKQIVRLNESFSRQVVSLFYTYRKLGPPLGFSIMRAPEAQKLGTLLASIGNDKFRFSPDVVRPVLEKNRADIEWMEARLGTSLDEELSEVRPGDIRDESDLLAPDPEVAHKLLKLLGRAAPKGIQGKSPEEVAGLVHAFRKKHEKTRISYP